MNCDSANKGNCPCVNTNCDRYEKCCECVTHHKKLGNLPSCLRDNESKQ